MSTMYPPSVLAVMFEYQPSTNVTAPKHRAVAEARAVFDKEVDAVFAEIALQEGEGSPPDFFVLHKEISDAALVYATVINETFQNRFVYFAEHALDQVVFARMWANKALHAPAGAARGRLIALSKTASELAEMAANNGIAISGPMDAEYTNLLQKMTAEAEQSKE